MNLQTVLFRIGAALKHRFTAVNTLGHGIHSPYLYNLVRFVFYDDNRYYCFTDIEKQRRAILHSTKTIQVEDYGVGRSGQRKVSDIAAFSLMPPKEAQLLFRVLNSQSFTTCVELGTSLGITTAYLSVAAGKKGCVYTFEGSEQTAEVAKKVWTNLKLNNINLYLGNIDDTLAPFLEQIKTLDFAIIDANHTLKTTVSYFNLIVSKCTNHSIVVLDDINYSKEMAQAWQTILSHPQVTTTINCGDMGFVFFNPQFIKKHYRIRI